MMMAFDVLLSFLAKSWRIVLPIVVVVVVYAGGYYKGHQAASANCRAAQLQAELDSVRRDVAAAKEAQAAEAAAAAELTAENEKMRQEIDDYEAQIAANPDSACPLSDDELRRLRRLGGR